MGVRRARLPPKLAHDMSCVPIPVQGNLPAQNVTALGAY